MPLSDYKSLYRTLPCAVVLSDLKTGAVLECNPAAERLLQMPRSDMVRLRRSDLFPSDEEGSCHDKIQDCLAKGQPVNYEAQTSRDIPVLINMSVSTLGRKDVVIQVITDMTEHKQAEEEQGNALAEKAAILDAMNDAVVVSDFGGNIISYNKAAEETWARDGFDAKDFLGKPGPNLPTVRPEDTGGYERIREDIVKNGVGGPFERCTTTGRWESISISPLKDEAGNPRGFVAVVRNITERKQAEKEQWDVVVEKAAILDAMPDGVLASDLQGRITFYNASAEEIWARDGIDAKELIGKSGFDLPHLRQEDVEGIVEIKEEVTERGTGILIERCTTTGRWESISVSPLKDKSGNTRALVTVVRNITERKQMEEALRESEERWRLLIQNTPDIILTVDHDGTILSINRTFLGTVVEDVIGRSVYDGVAPEYCETVRKSLERVFQTGKPEICDVLGTGIQGLSTAWYEVRVVPIERNEKVLNVTLIGTDITQRKDAEAQLRKSLTEKELLLKELHHRVKNNLQIISSLLSLQSKYIRDERALQMFEETQNRVMSMALFHDKIYRSEDLASVDFAAYVKSIVAELFHSYGVSSSCIRTKMDMNDIRLGVDVAIPCGLIINELVSNSIKHAFPDKERGEISVGTFSNKDGDYTLTVSDNGVGFPRDVDFTNTESLGMQLVVALTRQLEGTIELDRSSGTAFRITFGGPKAVEEG